MHSPRAFFNQQSLVFAIVFLACNLLPINLHSDEIIKDDLVTISWLAPLKFGSEPTKIGLYFEPKPGWHVYWKNSGDSGAPPKFKLNTEGGESGPILWPYPKRLPVAHLTNLGYEGSVAYLFEVTPKLARLKIKAELEWLVCKIECVPGFGRIELSRPTVNGASVWKNEILSKLNSFEARVPNPGELAGISLTTDVTPTNIKLSLNGASKYKEVDVFPLEGEFISPATPTRAVKGESIEFTLALNQAAMLPKELGFVVVLDGRAFEFSDVTLITSSSEGRFSFVLLISAFIGGIILNLMPCVFPVLSIKVLSLVRNNAGGIVPVKVRLKHALFYSLGILVTFIALGGAFLILRAFGSQVGWGFQLQSPRTIMVLIVLFWLMALNLLGFFEFGAKAAALVSRSKGWGSSFGTGVLSVIVATPCTGPFMGSALGAAATLPNLQAMLIFISLGLGLSFPFIVLALTPALLSKLPKAGSWMETLKQFLAFPLFATVLWLLWVLGQQSGNYGWMLGGMVLLGSAFSIWLGSSKKRPVRFAATVFATVVITLGIWYATPINSSMQDTRDGWHPYDGKEIGAARARGQNLFIDFTAAWCITCQINKTVTLKADKTVQLFKENNVLLMRADWTKKDPIIAKALQDFGRNSVPLYVYLSKESQTPKILPQILTFSDIQRAISER